MPTTCQHCEALRAAQAAHDIVEWRTGNSTHRFADGRIVRFDEYAHRRWDDGFHHLHRAPDIGTCPCNCHGPARTVVAVWDGSGAPPPVVEHDDANDIDDVPDIEGPA